MTGENLQQLFPAPFVPVDEDMLRSIYGYPPDLERCWVQANFASSADGAATVDGDSDCLSSPTDRRVLAIARGLADAIMVGITTAVLGQYETIRVDQDMRARLGLSPHPPLVLVTNRCSIGPGSPLITGTPVPSIVITCRHAPSAAKRDLVSAGADLIIAGDDAVDLRAALRTLAERGLRGIDCEGGPTLFGALIADDLVDALCLTVSPFLTGGADGRISSGQPWARLRRMVLDSVLQAEDSVFLKYRNRT